MKVVKSKELVGKDYVAREIEVEAVSGEDVKLKQKHHRLVVKKIHYQMIAEDTQFYESFDNQTNRQLKVNDFIEK